MPNHASPVTVEPRRYSAIRYFAGMLQGVVLLAPLGWLLGRLVWLWFYFGLFFFLLAGLLAGSFVFRTLRPLRPIRKQSVWLVCGIPAAAAWSGSVYFEYRHVAGTIGDPPKFARARTALASAGVDTKRLDPLIERAFDQALARDYPPGGMVGYVRWTFSRQPLDLRIPQTNGVPAGPFTDQGAVQHEGIRWPIRAAATLLLLFVGLWWQLIDLSKQEPVNNMIDPELGEELEREELREAGEPGFIIFDHTADLGMEARGKTWAGLLEQAARGLMATIGKLQLLPQPPRRERIELSAPTREELLRDWLAELLYRFETANQAPGKMTFQTASDSRIIADVDFRQVDRAASTMRREVKAVTYHALSISKIKHGLSARVILDI